MHLGSLLQIKIDTKMLKYILDDRNFVTCICPYLWLISSPIVLYFEIILDIKSSYGRYNIHNHGIPARLAWFMQELPSFVIPCCLLYYHGSSSSLTQLIIVGLFLIHYVQRYDKY